MKFTLSWLKDHLDTTASLDEISKTLTAIGLEVEQIADRGAALQPFTVAKIITAEKHPEADKLRVCKVLSDVGELQIVCGAPNARAGIFVVLAKEGAIIPNGGMVIKKTKIRGIESNGMLCSAEELALPGDSSGIIELPEASQVGEPAANALGFNDPVVEIAITPNRADCLGVHGIARDLAAAGLGTLKPLADVTAVKGSFKSDITVTIADTTHCLQFIGCTIKGVKNSTSPDWLKKRLEAIGQKSISTLVDITNYITFDLGRPLHVYDVAKLYGNLAVRNAKEGEKLKALNNVDYLFSDRNLLPTVIADEKAPVSIAGIIGGSETGCGEHTKDVFLEVALFSPQAVAYDGRKLAIDSDARYRFERGVDVAFVEEGAKIAIAMIQKLCGGEASELVIAGKTPEWKRTINFNPERVKTLGGVDIAPEKSLHILKSLGFTGSTTITPPSWRADIEGEADLIEEVLRIHGYNHIPSTPLPKLAGISKPALNSAQKRVHIAKRALAECGMLEVCTYSFIPQAQASMFGGNNPKLKLLNPISADLDTMRPSLLPNLLEAAKKNAARGFKSLSLFEVGLQFHDIAPDGQRMMATGIHSGFREENTYKNALFQHSSRAADTFDAKADALHVLETLGLSKCDITTNTPAWYHPGRSGALTLGGKIILGYFGELHPGLLPAFDLSGSVVAFELFLDAIPLPRSKGKAKSTLKPSDFQAVERDFAFIVDEKITAAEMIKAILQAEKQLITDVEIFDVYTGTGVEHGKKSVAIKVMLQAADRTLSETDIAAVCNAIITTAGKHFGGQLRQ